MIKYPAAIDSQVELPYVVDNVTPISGDLINNLRDAVVAMETELGVKPSGIYANVRSRINALEITVGNLVLNGGGGGGVYGGDLESVNTTTQKVVGLQGRNLASTAPTDGYLITWNDLAAEWQPLPPPVSFTAGGDLAGTNTNQEVVSLTGSGGIVSIPSAALAFGVSPATTGTIRAANGLDIIFRNVTDDGDIPFLTNSSDSFIIGDDTLVNSVAIHATSSFLWGTANAGIYNTSGSGYAIYVDGTHTELANNIGLLGGESTSTFGSGVGVIYHGNATTVPSANPTNGYLQYSDSGNTYIRTSSGIVQSVNGTRVSVSMPDSNYTALQADYQSNIIEFTGTLTANRDIILPATNGYRWTVFNNTNFSLTFKVSGQPGVIVSSGEKCNVYANGVDIVPAGFNGVYTVAPIELQFISNTTATSLSTFQRVGARSIDMSLWPLYKNGLTRNISFQADVQKTITATSVEIQLYDITNNVLITGTNLVSTSNAATLLSANSLPVGASAGNIRTDVGAQYEVQLRMNGGSDNDLAYCLNARLLISYS